MNATQFHLPTKPLTLIDAINRCAAATGSVGYAMATSDAEYNGHHLTLSWNDYRRYYVGQYYWGERVVITRTTDFAQALANMKREFARQGRGASLSVYPREQDIEIARGDTDLIEGKEAEAPWRDWKFAEVSMALRQNITHLLIAARDYEHYRRLQGWTEVETVWPNGEPSKGWTIDLALAERERVILKQAAA